MNCNQVGTGLFKKLSLLALSLTLLTSISQAQVNNAQGIAPTDKGYYGKTPPGGQPVSPGPMYTEPIGPPAKPTYGPGSAGTPPKTDGPLGFDYDKKGFVTPQEIDIHNALGHFTPDAIDYSLNGFKTNANIVIDDIKIRMKINSQGAEVGVKNCDKPYFEAYKLRFRQDLFRANLLKGKITQLKAMVEKALANKPNELRQAIRDMDEGGGVKGVAKTAVEKTAEAALDAIPGAASGKDLADIAVAGSSDADKVKLKALEQSWTRLEKVWGPDLQEIEKVLNNLIDKGTAHATVLDKVTFDASQCTKQVCGKQVATLKDEPKAQMTTAPKGTPIEPPSHEEALKSIHNFALTLDNIGQKLSSAAKPPESGTGPSMYATPGPGMPHMNTPYVPTAPGK